jgi:hypothetical protein
VVFGQLRNIYSWGVDLGHCVIGFRWFLGSGAIFFNGVDFELDIGGFGWFLGSLAIFF